MRYVLVDRFLELEKGKRARARKCVTLGEPFLRDLPAYPAALVLEALLQTGGVLARATSGPDRASVLGKVNRAEFPAECHAGDRIDLEVKALLNRPDGTLCEGTATVKGKLVGRAEFMIIFLPPELSPHLDEAARKRRRQLMRALRIPVEER